MTILDTQRYNDVESNFVSTYMDTRHSKFDSISKFKGISKFTSIMMWKYLSITREPFVPSINRGCFDVTTYDPGVLYLCTRDHSINQIKGEKYI